MTPQTECGISNTHHTHVWREPETGQPRRCTGTGNIVIPAELVHRARQAEANFGATLGPDAHEFTRMAAENARIDVIRELWAFVAVPHLGGMIGDTA